MTRATPPGKVRIIGGTWRRRWLPVPAGVRPTSDRVRETLFNWLQPFLAGAHCLDLYAGSGALGLEALSRGASRTTLVESAPGTARILREVAARLGAVSLDIIEDEARRFLTRTPPVPFTVVFLDPPYASEEIPQMLPLLMAGWLAAAAHVYIETAREADEITLPEGWRMIRNGRTRDTRYALLLTA
jgi:16S rRNA (guanine966-N2)-methyltransferase